MKGSRKIAEATKVVEICKKIKQEFPDYHIEDRYFDIDTMAEQLKLVYIKQDYEYFVNLYNNLQKKKKVNDHFSTEEGKSLKLQLEDTIKEGKENKNKIFDEYHEIFRSLVKSKFGQDFDIDEGWHGLEIAHSDTIEYNKKHNSNNGETPEFSGDFNFMKYREKNPFILIRSWKDEIIIETFGFAFMELKDNKKQTELFVKTASLLSDKELQNKIISLFDERHKKIDEITKIIEDAENKLKNPLNDEN